MRGDLYQYSLIGLSAVTAALLGVFVYEEVFPEYKVYQDTYQELEEFRSAYTGGEVPPFKRGVKQLVLMKPNNGPEDVDRCITCHVALNLQHFSPTQVARDVNGEVIVDDSGIPVQVPNEDYIWAKIDAAIQELEDETVLVQLRSEGHNDEVSRRQKEAEKLAHMKTVHIHGAWVKDMTKALSMHPLMGKETRPFELHPVEEYGCVSCHNGNGRSITYERAHGPVFDGDYHESFEGHEKVFTESDPENDPQFARVFNHKPGHKLLFQTTPIFVGNLMEAKCSQCHMLSEEEGMAIMSRVDRVTERKERDKKALENAVQSEKQAIVSLLKLRSKVYNSGFDTTLDGLKKENDDLSLTATEVRHLSNQIQFLEKAASGLEGKQRDYAALKVLDETLKGYLGKDELVRSLDQQLRKENRDLYGVVEDFLEMTTQKQSSPMRGTIFAKSQQLQKDADAVHKMLAAAMPLHRAYANGSLRRELASDAEMNMVGYERGKNLFQQMACYACHKIAGFSRGSVGPELTEIGLNYPWYIKESIVNPQANLASSAMPNFKLDADVVGDVMTYLLAQRGAHERKSRSLVEHNVLIRDWEGGKKLHWEEPLAPTQMEDLNQLLAVYTSEGCASCHRMKGIDSRIQLKAYSHNDFNQREKDSRWFRSMFPEDLPGSLIVERIEKYAGLVDEKIADMTGRDEMLERLEVTIPGKIEDFYSNFKFALRAKNTGFDSQVQSDWVARVMRVLKVYTQEYGLGGNIGPRLHYSGVYRDSRWLLEHFQNPSSTTPKSLMPVMPFDESKFVALSSMLRHMGIKNRERTRELWDHEGFRPERAYELYCAACHGAQKHGNGPLADWIYPIPKNLANATFLRNLTKEHAILSIRDGVQGTPMPPWGSADGSLDQKPVMSESEIEQLVDWLFAELPGAEILEDSDILKWKYTPEDILRELNKEGVPLRSKDLSEAETDETHLSALVQLRRLGNVSALCTAGVTMPKMQEMTVDEVFDVLEVQKVPSYYIKKSYYTSENITAGQQLFLVNCAHCHGKEADGTGDRAETMNESKPRMLTNSLWIANRDDRYLLAAIKYGVPGTAMTPWGDHTSMIQRMQMVVFLRSLTHEKTLRMDVEAGLFDAFQIPKQAIGQARVKESQKAVGLDDRLTQAIANRQGLSEQAEKGSVTTRQAAEAYAYELGVKKQIEQAREIDSVLLELKGLIEEETALYTKVGGAILSSTVLNDEFVGQFVELLRANRGRFWMEKGGLAMEETGALDTQRASREEGLLKMLNDIGERKARELDVARARLSSAQKAEDLNQLHVALKSVSNMREMLLEEFRRAEKLRSVQRKTYERYHLAQLAQMFDGQPASMEKTQGQTAQMIEIETQQSLDAQEGVEGQI